MGRALPLFIVGLALGYCDNPAVRPARPILIKAKGLWLILVSGLPSSLLCAENALRASGGSEWVLVFVWNGVLAIQLFIH